MAGALKVVRDEELRRRIMSMQDSALSCVARMMQIDNDENPRVIRDLDEIFKLMAELSA